MLCLRSAQLPRGRGCAKASVASRSAAAPAGGVAEGDHALHGAGSHARRPASRGCPRRVEWPRLRRPRRLQDRGGAGRLPLQRDHPRDRGKLSVSQRARKLADLGEFRVALPVVPVNLSAASPAGRHFADRAGRSKHPNTNLSWPKATTVTARKSKSRRRKSPSRCPRAGIPEPPRQSATRSGRTTDAPPWFRACFGCVMERKFPTQ